MRTFILTLTALAALAALATVGCQTHMRAGGGRGFDAGASIGRDTSYYAAPPVVLDMPPR